MSNYMCGPMDGWMDGWMDGRIMHTCNIYRVEFSYT